MLVQDYHFALVPRMIKEARPDARVAIFWHIPWPNPEAFGICPWQRELLDGLLGADLIGFHIQSHCNNFLDTVDRTLESRIDRERFAVKRGGHIHLVRPFPISVAVQRGRRIAATRRISRTWNAPRCCAKLGVEARMLGIGVDRIDYTKGIPERFRGIEMFLRKLSGRIADNSRSCRSARPAARTFARYHELMDEVNGEAERINRRFQIGRLEADRSAGAPSQPAGDPAVLPRGRPVPGNVAARRNEPGGQGIRRRALRRAGCADSQPLRRREPGAGGRAAGESLRHRATGGRDSSRAGNVASGEARPHGPHARVRPRAQHLPVGGQSDQRVSRRSVSIRHRNRCANSLGCWRARVRFLAADARRFTQINKRSYSCASA